MTTPQPCTVSSLLFCTGVFLTFVPKVGSGELTAGIFVETWRNRTSDHNFEAALQSISGPPDERNIIPQHQFPIQAPALRNYSVQQFSAFYRAPASGDYVFLVDCNYCVVRINKGRNINLGSVLINETYNQSQSHSMQLRKGYYYNISVTNARANDTIDTLGVRLRIADGLWTHPSNLSSDINDYSLQIINHTASIVAIVGNRNTSRPLPGFTTCQWARLLKQRPAQVFFTYGYRVQLVYSYDTTAEFSLAVHDETRTCRSPDLFDGNWHHVCTTWSAESVGSWRIYVNGDAVGWDTSFSTFTPVPDNETITLGKLANGSSTPTLQDSGFFGQMADFNMWGVQLPTDNIRLMATYCGSFEESVIPKAPMIEWRMFLRGLKGDVIAMSPSRCHVMVNTSEFDPIHPVSSSKLNDGKFSTENGECETASKTASQPGTPDMIVIDLRRSLLVQEVFLLVDSDDVEVAVFGGSSWENRTKCGELELINQGEARSFICTPPIATQFLHIGHSSVNASKELRFCEVVLFAKRATPALTVSFSKEMEPINGEDVVISRESSRLVPGISNESAGSITFNKSLSTDIVYITVDNQVKSSTQLSILIWVYSKEEGKILCFKNREREQDPCLTEIDVYRPWRLKGIVPGYNSDTRTVFGNFSSESWYHVSLRLYSYADFVVYDEQSAPVTLNHGFQTGDKIEVGGFTGRLSCLQIYTRKLTVGEISELKEWCLYNKIVLPQPFLLDSLSSPRVISLGAFVTSVGPSVWHWGGILGQRRGSFSFTNVRYPPADCSTYTYLVHRGTLVGKTKHSISLFSWILFYGGTPHIVVITIGASYNDSDAFSLSLQSNSKLKVLLKLSHSFTLEMSSRKKVTRYAWHLIGFIYRGRQGAAQIWVDGKLDKEMIVGSQWQYTIQEIWPLHIKFCKYPRIRITCLQLYDVALNRKQLAIVRYKCLNTDSQAVVGPPTLTSSSTTLLSPTAINIRWYNSAAVYTIPGFVSAYMVKFEESSVYGTSTSAIVSRDGSSTYTMENLKPLTTYKISVKALGIPSAQFSEPRLKKTIILYAPNITALNITTDTIEISIVGKNTSDSISSFNIYYSQKVSGGYPNKRGLSREAPDAKATAIFTGLQDLTMYRIEAAALIESYTGPCAMVEITTKSFAPTIAPTNLTASQITSFSIALIWLSIDSPQRILGYRIYYTTITKKIRGSTSHIDTVSTSNTNVTVTGLEAWSLYHFEVLPYTPEFEGPNVTLCVKTKSIVPSAPLDIYVYRVSNTELYVDWLPPFSGNIGGYQIFYTQLNTTAECVVVICSTYVYLKNLVAGANYSVQVSSFTEYEGILSNVSYPVQQRVPTGSPRVGYIGYTTQTAFTCWWHQPNREERNGVLNWVYFRVTEVTCAGIPVANQSVREKKMKGTGVYIRFKNLKPGTCYMVQVAAFTIGLGPWSQGKIRKTLAEVPTQPPTPTQSTVTLVSPSPTPSSPSLSSTISNMNSTPSPGNVSIDNNTSASDTVVYLTSGLVYGTSSTRSSTVPESSTVLHSWPTSKISATTKPPVTELPINCKAILINEIYTENLCRKNSSAFLALERRIKSEVMKDFAESPRSISDVYLLECSNGSVIVNFTVVFASHNTDDLLKLQESLENSQMIGSLPIRVIDYQTNAVPDIGPEITSVIPRNASHTEVQWNPVIISSTYGTLLGYRVKYSDINSQSWSTAVCYSCQSLMLHGLQPLTTYRLRALAFTTNGGGISGPAVEVRTPEGVPRIAPQNIEGTSQGSTSIIIEWNAMSPSDVPGTLLGYKLRFKQVGSNTTIEITNYPTNLFVQIRDLKPFVTFKVSVTAYTVAGEGPSSPELVITTQEDVPIAPPANVTVVDYMDVGSVIVKWLPVPLGSRNGRVTNYRLEYVLAQEGYETPKSPTSKRIIIPGHLTTYTLTGLQAFAEYTIRVQASTSRGYGPFSPDILARTCRCPADLYTNYASYPPYVNVTRTSKVGGIFGSILRTMIRSVCDVCPNGHKETTVHFDTDGNGGEAIKSSLILVKESIDHKTHISFPVSGRTDDSRYMGEFVFLPLVQSPGIAFITSVSKGSTAGSFIASINTCWPIVVLSFTMACLAAIVIWGTDTRCNQGQFPTAFTHGVWEGFWWSFVSMTTVGYGDKAPYGPVARFIAICWVLTGLVLISIFTSIVTSSLTIQVVEERTMLYGTKVAAIMNSTEYRIGILKNAKMATFSNIEESYQALLSGEVKGLLVDTYAAGSMNNVLSGSAVEVNRIIEHALGYGVVLSGPIMALEAVFKNYLMQNRQAVTQIIERNIKTLESGEASMQESSVSTVDLMDVTSAFYQRTVLFIGTALILAVCCGMAWNAHNKSKFNADKEVAKLKEKLANERDELRYILEEFYINITSVGKRLKEKHIMELKQMPRIYRNREGCLVTCKENVSSWQSDVVLRDRTAGNDTKSTAEKYGVLNYAYESSLSLQTDEDRSSWLFPPAVFRDVEDYRPWYKVFGRSLTSSVFADEGDNDLEDWPEINDFSARKDPFIVDNELAESKINQPLTEEELIEIENDVAAIGRVVKHEETLLENTPTNGDGFQTEADKRRETFSYENNQKPGLLLPATAEELEDLERAFAHEVSTQPIHSSRFVTEEELLDLEKDPAFSTHKPDDENADAKIANSLKEGKRENSPVLSKVRVRYT